MMMRENTFENLLSKKELVKVFGVSSSFISKLMAKRGLPYFKLGRAVRFKVSQVSKWLDGQRIQ
jgi:excisionase family DNA binding protein